MAKFTCDSCGRCCSSFGALIKIERQLNDRDYYCRYGVTNEVFPVRVDAAFTDEIDGRFSAVPDVTSGTAQRSCPFLCRRPDGEGLACAIYATRPPVCREFRCYRMLVYDKTRHLAGRVIGGGEISTDDPLLARFWKEECAAIPHAHPPGGNDPAWVQKVTVILATHGYIGDAVE
jgi:uncharacterized protein